MSVRLIRVWPDGQWQDASSATLPCRRDDTCTITVLSSYADAEVDQMAQLIAAETWRFE